MGWRDLIIFLRTSDGGGLKGVGNEGGEGCGWNVKPSRSRVELQVWSVV
jgi:hypothetical protein